MALKYTFEQEKCIKSFEGPLDISAGAGSGKTFTLTQRIVQALLQPDSGVESINQVCAITFTNKAATELKGRVRTSLRGAGLFQEASQVDGAWISTIHGMCSRILRQCALDLGIDPEFKVITEEEAADLLHESLSEAIELLRSAELLQEEEENEFVEKEGLVNSSSSSKRSIRGLMTLFKEYPANDEMRASVSTFVEALIQQASSLRNGFDDLIVVESTDSPYTIVQGLLQEYEQVLPSYRSANPGKQNTKSLQIVEDNIRHMRDYVSMPRDEADQVQRLFELLDICPQPDLLRASNLAEASLQCRRAHQECIVAALLLHGNSLLVSLIDLAKNVQEIYSQKKQSSAVLDNNDLIKMTLSALEIPDIHQRFAHKFRMVMVDEFQDTDNLQLEIVQKISGAGCRYLCTVGDAQQSIYAFRGADINVYRSYRKALSQSSCSQDCCPQLLQLTSNFRSHKSILDFVRTVCSQPNVFGNEFLDLEDHYNSSLEPISKQARIQLNVSRSVPSEGKSASIGEARKLQAKQIANFFKLMHQDGYRLADMVLLLGSATHATEYAAEVRRAGFPCIITGGSLFWKSREVALINSMVQALANPCNTQALFDVLVSPVFNMDAASLLKLATSNYGCQNDFSSCSIDEGLRQLLPDQDDVILNNALATLKKAQLRRHNRSLHEVLVQVLQDSGLLLRLSNQGPEGMAQLGNIMKAIRIVEDIENNASDGISSTAARFTQMFTRGNKEAPGALNLEGQEAVRIMTIHASKGLEFPVVALADFSRDRNRSEFLTQRINGKTFVCLKGKNRKLAGQDKCSAAARALCDEWENTDLDVVPEVLEKMSITKRYAALSQLAEQERIAEEQRLFYVGATRAKEALCVFVCERVQKNASVKAGRGTVNNIREALFGNGAFPEKPCSFDYGGSDLGEYHVSTVSAKQDSTNNDFAKSQTTMSQNTMDQIMFPEVEPDQLVCLCIPKTNETGLFSYSLLQEKENKLSSGTEKACLANEDNLNAGVLPDGEKQTVEKIEEEATSFGSAFHALAQIAAQKNREWVTKNLDNICMYQGIKQKDRLIKALDAWFSSPLCKRAFAFEKHIPEVSFCVPVGNMVLEGSIDLLCYNLRNKSQALIIDYKTGDGPTQSIKTLQEKHALQARCYAYAALCEGFTSLDIVFVHVEQTVHTSQNQAACKQSACNEAGSGQAESGNTNKEAGSKQAGSENTNSSHFSHSLSGLNGLQEIHYSFTKKDLPELRQSLLEAQANLLT